MHVVTVEFTIDPRQFDRFLPLMLDNARRSRAEEPGCRQFDVSVDDTRQDIVYLYEVYDDRAAFDAHLASPHFVSFAAATAGMITDRVIRNWRRIAP
ncbi:MAG: antibiotic biosynthesis monooxygenase [Betaproteobacteria bacterium]|nr:antibiotic biosynthesis monooxygenase [Betaproteobacteria bacterium]